MVLRGSQDNCEIAVEIQKRIEGEVRFERYSGLLYATDASVYEIEPISQSGGLKGKFKETLVKTNMGIYLEK